MYSPVASRQTYAAAFRPANIVAFGVWLNHRQHLRSLDGVRGLAILMVFCHHLCPWAAGSPLGVLCATLWLGVDLFFVLSGFLITGLLYDTLREPRFFVNFYGRRALRLMPAYVALVLLVSIANALLGGRPTVWVLPYFLYAGNIIRDLGLPIGIVLQLDVSHLWSLAVEEQFYLVWPLVVWWARSRQRIAAICIVGSLVSVVLRLVAAGHAHFFLGTPYFELPMRLDSLLLGGALAMLVRSPQARAMISPLQLYLALAAGLLTLALSFAAAGHGTMFSAPLVRYGYFSAAMAFTALIGLAVEPGTRVSRIGETSFLRALGRCSYGLYLIHLVPAHWYREVLQLAQRSGRTDLQREAMGTLIFLGYFALCFGVATLSYNTLERYFLRKKRLFQYRDEADASLAGARGLPDHAAAIQK